MLKAGDAIQRQLCFCLVFAFAVVFLAVIPAGNLLLFYLK
jgi:hypothetical protein